MKTNLILSALLTNAFAASLFATACTTQTSALKLDHAQVENIVRRSYAYVALYNVINKAAMDPGPMSTHGWNKLFKFTRLADATLTTIARPNNDSLYQLALLDLRDEPVILEVPAFDSKYVSMETSAYDHYLEVPMATRRGDFKEPQKVLFYSARTKGYKPGDKIEGMDRYLEMSGDFAMANIRVMPHANDPARFQRIVGQIESLKLMTLSEYQGKPGRTASEITFPAYGATDADIFGNNLLEVMQFVFNHTTFDPKDKLDQAVLASYKPLGVEPGKPWNPATAATIDGAMFRAVSEEVKKATLAMMNNPADIARLVTKLHASKGQTTLELMVVGAVIGPFGLPAIEAMYPPITTADGQPMNARHDYVVKMTKDELPPAKAFWSLTLYDTKNGFFIPNKQNKYSVGENAGFKLNADGGIEIHVAAGKPAGVPDENWLPINRGDEGLYIILRVYVPDLEKMKTWKAPKAVLVK